MKIPKSIRINGIEYEITYAPNLNDGTHVCYGHINFDTSTIEISSSLLTDHQHKCLTLWHEILHGIVQANDKSIEDEERIVNMFAKGIYQVLQDNGGRLFDLKTDEMQKDKFYRAIRADNNEQIVGRSIIHFKEENGDTYYILKAGENCVCSHDEKDNIISFSGNTFYKVIPSSISEIQEEQ